MSSTNNTADTTVKLSMRIDKGLWEAWKIVAKCAAYDPVDYIKTMMIKAVIEAVPPVLETQEKGRLERLVRLNNRIVEIARATFVNEPFSADLTLRIFRRAMEDTEFVKDYTAHIGGKDPYLHGNPLKDVNRELGWRIRNALPVEVVKDNNGKPVEQRNLKGEIIQSFSLLKLRNDDKLVAA